MLLKRLRLVFSQETQYYRFVLVKTFVQLIQLGRFTFQVTLRRQYAKFFANLYIIE